MASYIGIDLGTTYSAVATLDETGRPVIIDNTDMMMSPQGNITASCVSVSNNKLIIGEGPRKAISLADNAVGKFKREMGKSTTYTLNGETYTPTDLSAAVLLQMKKIAEDAVADLSKVVVTVPANFSNEAREATLKAAKKAGLDVDFIINEPTAAALHYGYKLDADLEGIYAIYDLGGGTFDISIISISGDKIDVLASNGIAQLGGHDFDVELTKIIKKKIKDQAGRDLDITDYTPFQAEDDKISLSNKKRIVAGGIEQNIDGLIISVTRMEFEEAISGLLAQTALVCDSTLDQAGVNKEEVSDIILAGGSTRMPAVRMLVERTFGKAPVTSENPDEAVALGAVLYAAMKSDGANLTATQKKVISKMSVQESCSKFLGTIVLDDVMGEKKQVNTAIIKKGEKIPCSVTRDFFTSSDGQVKINCRFTESENDETDPRWVTIAWQGDLELPPNRPAGQKIEITYSYDESQMIHCVYKDVESGRVTEATINGFESEESESAIDKFLVD